MDLSSPRTKAKIVLMGTPFSHGNRGVAALAASLVELCGDAMPGAQIQFHLLHAPMQHVELRPKGRRSKFPVICCRLSLKSAFKDHILGILLLAILYRLIPLPPLKRSIASSCNWIHQLEQASFVGDIRGGDSFSDIYGFKRFFVAALPVLTVILIHGSIVQLPQTFGPFRNPFARLLARALLRRSSIIVARDEESKAVAESLVGRNRPVILSPDVAFALHSIFPDQIMTYPRATDQVSKGTVGLNINALMYHGGYGRKDMFALKLNYRDFVPKLLTSLLAETSCEILLVPHTYAAPGDIESDNDVCRIVWEGLPNELRQRVRIVDKEYDQHELKGIIGKCDFFIGSRMHSCIAALSQGVPCVGVAYSMKFGGVFDSVGMKEWVVDGRFTDGNQAVSSVIRLYRARDSIRGGLAMRSEQARRHLGEIFGKVVQNAIDASPVGSGNVSNFGDFSS